MKIAMVSGHADPHAVLKDKDTGGQSLHVAELARALGERGHDVVVYTRRARAKDAAEAGFAPGVSVRRVPAGPARAIPADGLAEHVPAFGAWLAGDLARERPDIVHAHSWTSGMAALRGTAETGIPFVQTFHTLDAPGRHPGGDAETPPAERAEAERTIALACARVIATSVEERRELRTWGVPSDRIEVVPRGIDTTLFRPDGPVAPRGEQARVLCLGGLGPREGVDTVIRTLPIVYDTELVIAGGPAAADLDRDPDVARLRGVADRAGVADRVRFLGRVARTEVPPLLRSSDIVVNVPWNTPFGMVTVEAMACGVPVIASNVGGHRDTMIQDVTGRLVPPDDPRALAFWLRTLLADPVLKESYGIAAADRAMARYTWTLIARQTEERYERVLLERRPPAPRRGSETRAAANRKEKEQEQATAEEHTAAKGA
uniref:Glycosyltransferase n=1 Tax=Nocardiopsis sp. CMB-M0232 TaxID=1231934 RepID=A0A0D5BTS1_9ACTN|nr:glycosyltransferase [Nocardiopsis sp. CMB-M0232]